MSKRRYDGECDSNAKKTRIEILNSTPKMHRIFKGEVATVKEYGLFVKIPECSKQGLVHKSQISHTRIDDPTEMFAKGELVYCKVISISENGDKIGLAMKTVNQTTGHDQDPNNVELSQDSKKRQQMRPHIQKQKIVLEAVLDTICKKCGGKGHLAQDCFQTGESSYELIPDLDDYMKSIAQEITTQPAHKMVDHPCTKKKKHKSKKPKKEKRAEKDNSPGAVSSSNDHRWKEKKRESHHDKHSSHQKQKYGSSNSDADTSRKKKKIMKRSRDDINPSDT